MDYDYPQVSKRLEQLKRMKDEADGKTPNDKKREEKKKDAEEDEG